ncbi:DMT family transporter [Novosphingobium sp. P6W]|uniref:DMT family transporter n=1 Tax=Novosphingobium sp. P6W TaxID=1609758 RepID=UPI0005C2E18C|nr:DMT family transporter [Novosphingobium sp. P6W]AXB75754.1 DMT family transporter [Novosphingobium sp. P6W]KIS33034.1 permease [Novosphingobium sp. P6W]
MPESRSTTRAFLLLGLVMLFWAGNSITGRAVRGDIPPFTLAFGRWLIAVAVLAPFAVRRLWAERAEALAGWRWILALGFLGIVCFNAFIYSGLRHTSAANALLLQASIPALVLVLDRVMFGGRAGALHIAGVAASTLGVAGIVFKGDVSALTTLRLGAGDALILCGVVVWGLYTVLLRKKPAISSASFLLLVFTLGALAMAPLAAWEWTHGLQVAWSPKVLAAFGYVGVFPSVLAYFIYNAATAQLGPARAGQAITLMPLFGALLSALLLGETLEGYHLVGMALILAGIVLSALALTMRRTV